MEAFADASTFGMDDYQYLSDTPLGVFRSTRRPPRQQPKLRRKQVMAASATVGVLVILLFCRLMYNTYERLGGDLDKLAERREAQARGTHEAMGTAGAPEAAPAPMAPVDATPVSVTPMPNDLPMVGNARLAAALPGFQHAPVELPALAPGVPVAAAVSASAPAVPIPGDGAAVREAMTSPAELPSATDQAGAAKRATLERQQALFRTDDAQPQTVVNDRPSRPVN